MNVDKLLRYNLLRDRLGGCMIEHEDGEYVQYDQVIAVLKVVDVEVKQLISTLDELKAHIKVLEANQKED